MDVHIWFIDGWCPLEDLSYASIAYHTAWQQVFYVGQIHRHTYFAGGVHTERSRGAMKTSWYCWIPICPYYRPPSSVCRLHRWINTFWDRGPLGLFFLPWGCVLGSYLELHISDWHGTFTIILGEKSLRMDYLDSATHLICRWSFSGGHSLCGPYLSILRWHISFRVPDQLTCFQRHAITSLAYAVTIVIFDYIILLLCHGPHLGRSHYVL